MPSLLAPLIVGFTFQLIPFLQTLKDVASGEAYGFLSQLGIIFLLFLVGLRLNIGELRSLSIHIIALSILNLAFSTVLGFLTLLAFGYPPLISLIVSTALATVAETTIAPILDELGVIRTKVATLVLGPGVIDDVVEVVIASLASLIAGSGGYAVNPLFLAAGLLTLIALVILFHRLILPSTVHPNRKIGEFQLFCLMISASFLFTCISQYFGLGILLGAIVSGLVFQVSLKQLDSNPSTLSALTAIAYGLLGPIFFFGVGLSVSFSTLIDLEGFQLISWLLLANFIGKLLAAVIVGKIVDLNAKSMVIIGLGLSAKFSMGIIPVQIFYSAKLIDQRLFSAFIAVSTITTAIIPPLLSYIINRWRESIA
jgi:Ca2+-transporting ATPase